MQTQSKIKETLHLSIRGERDRRRRGPNRRDFEVGIVSS